MTFKYKLLVTAATLILGSPFIDGSAWLFALQQSRQIQLQAQAQIQPQTQSQIQIQKAIETQKTDQTPVKTANLSKEIRSLAKEIRQLNAQQRQILDLIFLKLEQERVDKLSDKFAAIESQLRILDTREKQFDFRLKNLDKELLVRNFINRSDGEKFVKEEIENERQEIKLERIRLEQEKVRMREEINLGNLRLDVIRTRLVSGLASPANGSELIDYFQSQEKIAPIATDSQTPKDE